MHAGMQEDQIQGWLGLMSWHEGVLGALMGASLGDWDGLGHGEGLQYSA